MKPNTNYFTSSYNPLKINPNPAVTIRCVCGYHGAAKQIAGRSTLPIHVCPECRRTVQRMEIVK